MNCHVCGHRQSDPEAAFCGECGVALKPPPDSAAGEVAVTLEQALHRLAELVEQQGFMPPRTALELRALAGAGEGSGRPTIVVMGQYRRGKSTVVNRLLGHDLVSVARQNGVYAVRIGRVPAESYSEDTQPLNCTAPILEIVDLVDTPAASQAEGQEVSLALRHALSAMAIVICIDARQALSAAEREILEEEVLPLTRCPVVLGVTFLDQVSDPADQAEVKELLLRYVRCVGDGRLELLMLEPGRLHTDPLPILEAWIRNQAACQTAAAADPAERLNELLALIEASLPQPSADRRDAAIEQRDLALSVLAREHRLALAEANSVFREGCSHLRKNLKPILRAAPERSTSREGMATVVHGLRKVVERAAETYLRTLRNALQADGPPALRAAGETINISAALQMRPPTVAAPALPVSSRRDGRATGLEAAALAVAVVIPGWITIVGAGISLVAVSNWRQAKRHRQQADAAVDAEAALQQWLTDIEPKLIEEFASATAKVMDEICQQVIRRFQVEEGEQAALPERDDIPRLIARCREFLLAEEL